MPDLRRAARSILYAGLALISVPAGALDLVGAYRLALENDANFLAARAATDAQREALPQARAGLLPNLSFSGSRGRTSTDITQSSVFGPLTRQFEYFAEGRYLTLRQPLYRRANLAQYRQAEAQVAGAELQLERERQNLAATVAGAYFDVLDAQDQLRAVREQKKAFEEQWKRFQAMFDKGAGTRTDRDEAKARHDLTVAQEVDAADALDLAERTLASITNSPSPSVSLAALDPRRIALETPVPDSFEEWVTLAQATNPELAALRFAIEVAAQEVTKQGSGHLPTLDLVVQRSYSASETVSIIGSQYDTRMLGVQVTIPIYSGGAVVSAERQAHANLERARQQYEAGRRRMALNIRKEFNKVAQGVVKIRALEQALGSAEEALRSTEMGVRAGTRNNLEVLNARQQMFGTQRDLGRARYDYIVGRLRLKAAAGTLSVLDLEAMNRWLAAEN